MCGCEDTLFECFVGLVNLGEFFSCSVECKAKRHYV